MADGNYTQFPIPYTVVDIEQIQSDLDTAEQNIETLGTSKQDKLTAGNGITMNGATISTDNDTTLESAIKPAQGKAVGDALALKADKTYVDDELAEKADINGTYPSLTAGLAEQLLSSNRVTDQTPYLYRQTALGKANATRALMKKIIGGSVVWNQLCNGSSVTVPSGHKYAAKIGGSWSISASTGTAITGLTAGTDMVTDLTALFGSATIADYIYSLEQATAGSGIAKLKEWGFFAEDYYEYDPGTMKSVEGVSAKETVGKNLFDLSDIKDYSKWSADIAPSGDMRSDSGNRIYSLPVLKSGVQYTISFGITSESFPTYLYFGYYKDGSATRIEYVTTNIFSKQSVSFTAIAGVTYCLRMGSTSTDFLFNNQIAKLPYVQLEVGSSATDYEPYAKYTYPLDSTKEWRGIFKLDENNNLYADGDIYPPSGEASRRYALVGLGTLNWTHEADSKQFYSSIFVSGYSGWLYNVLCSKYIQDNRVYAVVPTAHVRGINNNRIYIVDDSYTDAATFKQAMTDQNVQLLYELATPTTETAEPYTEVQVVDKDGTEEFVTTGIVPVGHVTEYPEDLVGKIDELPDLPETAGSYVLRVTVTSGKASYEWVSAS